MMSNTMIKLRRLEKQEQSLINDPLTNILVKREGERNFYFCIYGLDGPYKGGFYYGLLQLHENYPFAAPKLFFYTPSGRFQLSMPICTSFTNYHQESWTSAWNVRSLLLGTVSFMTSDQASYGCRNDSNQVKMKLAQKSLQYNIKIKNFCELFQDQLKRVKPPVPQRIFQLMNRTLNEIQPEIRLEESGTLSNEGQNAIIPLNPNPNQNNPNRRVDPNKCKKILILCGVAIPTLGLIFYLIFR